MTSSSSERLFLIILSLNSKLCSCQFPGGGASLAMVGHVVPCGEGAGTFASQGNLGYGCRC